MLRRSWSAYAAVLDGRLRRDEHPGPGRGDQPAAWKFITFGDKRSLYIQTLRRYGHLALAQTFEDWKQEESILNNLRAVLMQSFKGMPKAEQRRGNMICNCIVKWPPHDPAIAHIVEEILKEFSRRFSPACPGRARR